MTPNDNEKPTPTDRRVANDDPLRELAFILKMTQRVKDAMRDDRPTDRDRPAGFRQFAVTG